MSLDPDAAAWMQRALDLAWLGVKTVTPNPAVGAVLVSDREEIGAGYHQRAGGPHAEVIAIRAAASAGREVRGATLYVTLEPCSSYGRTPPCVDAIVEAGIREVVVGTLDPNPRHAGRGIRILQRLGLDVTSGVLEGSCNAVNPEFNERMRTASRGVAMIWSGGQTGVDREALDWAIRHGLPHGGWCPHGRKAEDGRIPDRYRLRETPSENPDIRTRWNVEDSDATLILAGRLPLQGGTAWTELCARDVEKPYLVLAAEESAEAAESRLREWLNRHHPAVLNIAGPRYSEDPAAIHWTRTVLDRQADSIGRGNAV